MNKHFTTSMIITASALVAVGAALFTFSVANADAANAKAKAKKAQAIHTSVPSSDEFQSLPPGCNGSPFDTTTIDGVSVPCPSPMTVDILEDMATAMFEDMPDSLPADCSQLEGGVVPDQVLPDGTTVDGSTIPCPPALPDGFIELLELIDGLHTAAGDVPAPGNGVQPVR